MANREACELMIEQEIEVGLEKGQTPYAIGKGISEWVEKMFETKIPPRTIESRAQRQKSKNTSNEVKKTQAITATSILEKTHGGKREDSGRKPLSVFNETNENIEWARWTWNPVTGCEHGCKYCYARDIANRFFKEKFKPTFHTNRLTAPQNTKLNGDNPKFTKEGNRNVFVCSMADLFGEWVPNEWIEQVFKAIREAPQWNFIMLTKNPERYLDIKEWPDNVWIGATADTQSRANTALGVFEEMRNNNGSAENLTLFLSCEPLNESVMLAEDVQRDIFPPISDMMNPPLIDWLIIGGQSKTMGEPASQPEWYWVESLMLECIKFDIPYYFKPNLTVRPRMYPE